MSQDRDTQTVEVLKNLRSRLQDKRDLYRRCKDIESMSAKTAHEKENAMNNAIVIVEQFIESYQ